MIFVNGEPVEPAAANPTIRDVLVAIEVDPERSGIAVAVDAEIARRSLWTTQRVADGARLEIVTATQGG